MRFFGKINIIRGVVGAVSGYNQGQIQKDLGLAKVRGEINGINQQAREARKGAGFWGRIEISNRAEAAKNVAVEGWDRSRRR